VAAGGRRCDPDPSKNTNIRGVHCKDHEGETYDCTATCGCPLKSCARDADCQAGSKCLVDPSTGMGTCPDSSCTAFNRCTGAVVQCTKSTGAYDCTQDCCCHDSTSGPQRCSVNCPKFLACAGQGVAPTISYTTPEIYDYTGIACLDANQQAHDGRIQMFAGSAQ
jgi:hypothetical protein